MGDRTAIAWTDATWNPTRGCSRVSPGCDSCYAIREARRHDHAGGSYHGLTRVTAEGRLDWSGRVRFVPEVLALPLHWREARRVFVDSMSDLFHETLDFHDIAAVYGVMAHARQHTFQILTKRPKRRLAFMRWMGELTPPTGAVMTMATDAVLGAEIAAGQRGVHFGPYDPTAKPKPAWPLVNVWEGVSIEDQATADERVPLLLETHAAVRIVSQEPQLGPITYRAGWLTGQCTRCGVVRKRHYRGPCDCGGVVVGVDQVIVGGESGWRARPFLRQWMTSAVLACRRAGVAVFCKQFGSNVREAGSDGRPGIIQWTFKHRHAADPSEWPTGDWPQEFPR